MRWAILCGVLAVLVAGCASTHVTTTPSTSADPGRDVFALLAASVRADNRASLSGLVSSRCRRPSPIRQLRRRLEPFTGGYRVLVSERITEAFGLVAVARGAAAFALPLRLTDGRWFADVCGPVSIEVLGPRPGSRGRVVQIGVEVHGRGADTAVIYVDGVTLPEPKLYSSATEATVFANLGEPLERGRHVAVAFVKGGGRAAARAWIFNAG